ncbi:hypothetical protein TSUD_62570 [Trifolium subterraneum]|uniref:DYW domain-containing protein n=1 Tax=Trifolium subterraneum TaxID=3900 RepID=A0A2Z6NLE3_TRISU|nr:hypothetical protein TSUD_62570 [Trifolium subterraneum]
MGSELKKWCLAEGFKSLKHVKLAHCRLLRLNLNHDNHLLNIILRSSLILSNTQYPILIFHKTTTNPNTFLYNTMIRGMVTKDRFHDAVQLYLSMHKASLVPDNFTFPFVLKACATFFNWVFDDIAEKNVVSWTAIICGCIEFGQCREAVDLFRELLETGLRPDGFVIVRVLRACAGLGDLESGRWIESMEEALGVYKMMKEKDRVVFNAVISGLSMYGHFGAAFGVFGQMGNLFKDLREAGYNPTTEFVLFGVEEEEKEYFLGCHSEKLAVAFALISTGANDVIRIVKNLRARGILISSHCRAVSGEIELQDNVYSNDDYADTTYLLEQRFQGRSYGILNTSEMDLEVEPDSARQHHHEERNLAYFPVA